MRVFLDENIPHGLRRFLAAHEVCFIEDASWEGIANGLLLARIEASFDVLVTADQSLVHQQNLVGRDLSVVIVPMNDVVLLRNNVEALRITLEDIAALSYPAVVAISCNGRRILHRIDIADQPRAEIAPVPPYGRRSG